MRRNPWAYQIDYDKVIEEEEAELARIERLFAAQLFKPDVYDDGGRYTLVDLVLFNEDAAARLGLDYTDRAALADLYEVEAPPWNVDVPPLRDKAYRAAKAWEDAMADEWRDFWTFDLPTKDQAKALRKRVKVSLARHRRNRARHGEH